MTQDPAAALAALTEAEQLARQIQRDLWRRALIDQLAVGARPELEHARPGSLAASLGLPAWAWMVWAGLAAVVFTAPAPGFLLLAGLAAALALVIRTWLTVQAAPQLFSPDAAALSRLMAALEAGAREMRALPTDPYRDHPCEWVGGDPTAAERPWTELSTIARTAAALRRRALPPGERPAGG
ncbi:hypothetical protein [Nannocystis punicea]|uniref:SLATT domain-containing protein n=1 Tax=Nannocystis punicea TaxID=2995304 RepID=A0ABY7HCT8_9BACT|nr:hypothetical protein [Nannocystis poenicansa]WAS97087.1 hypothetical protein O0S08_13145 [Nannocystis poenicansa]